MVQRKRFSTSEENILYFRGKGLVSHRKRLNASEAKVLMFRFSISEKKRQRFSKTLKGKGLVLQRKRVRTSEEKV